MIAETTDIYGCYLIQNDRFVDERGFFEPIFELGPATGRGLGFKIHHINHVLSEKVGTLRGLHYQIPPAQQIKLVTCVDGAILDVVVDLRPDSPTYKKSIGVPLGKNKAIFVPSGCAHGTMALEDKSHVIYATSNMYSPAAERILNWKYFLAWPMEPTFISVKDAQALNFDEDYHTRYLSGLCGSF